MLVQQGDARNSRIDRRLAAIFAAIAGAVNTVAFQAVGFFAANMTGNVSFASERIAFGQFALAGFYLLIVTAFISGAAIATLLINLGQRRGMKAIYALCILGEAAGLAALGLLNPLIAAEWRGPILVVGLSCLMGLQNAVVTRISNALVRTTHISGMATDIGIGLGMLLDGAREHEAGDEKRRARLQLHGMTVLAFLLGGLAGALLYRVIGSATLLFCALLLGLIALPEAMKARAEAKSVS